VKSKIRLNILSANKKSDWFQRGWSFAGNGESLPDGSSGSGKITFWSELFLIRTQKGEFVKSNCKPWVKGSYTVNALARLPFQRIVKEIDNLKNFRPAPPGF